jgi:5-carboxymethyl-2-hydroxymuconate isomerase
MPHITLEVPSLIKNEINWGDFFKKMHKNLADAGYGRLEDFKSRTIILDSWQVADQTEDAIFIFATLQTMNPRPQETIRAMGQIICSNLEQEGKKIAKGRWLQICVKVSGTPPEDYFKLHLNSPNLMQGLFTPGEIPQ